MEFLQPHAEVQNALAQLGPFHQLGYYGKGVLQKRGGGWMLFAVGRGWSSKQEDNTQGFLPSFNHSWGSFYALMGVRTGLRVCWSPKNNTCAAGLWWNFVSPPPLSLFITTTLQQHTHS